MEQTARYRYTIRKDSLQTEEGIAYTGYGIEIWEAGIRIQSVPDIFLHISDAEELAALCNQLQLEPIHFMEVAEDRLP